MRVHDRGNGRENLFYSLNEFRLVSVCLLDIVDDTGNISIHFGKSSSKNCTNLLRSFYRLLKIIISHPRQKYKRKRLVRND